MSRSYLSLAHLLRKARGSRSTYCVAKATGVAHSNLVGMELGKRFPNEWTLQTLCDYYEIDFDTAALLVAHDKLKQRDGRQQR